MRLKLYTEQDFLKMRKVGACTALILDELTYHIKPGLTTENINQFVHKKTLELDCIPAPLNYHGFPKSVCTSINNVVCHGIPSSLETLKDGDIINVDVTCIKDGYFGDASRMYCVGVGFADLSAFLLQKKLVETTYNCLMAGIAAVEKSGAKISDIGRAIEPIANAAGFSVVRDFCGHGIGTSFHEFPNILHHIASTPDIKIREGMIFTIEPMINEKEYHVNVDKKDKWTVRTLDGGLSAQFEHTIGIGKHGLEIFTLSEKQLPLW